MMRSFAGRRGEEPIYDERLLQEGRRGICRDGRDSTQRIRSGHIVEKRFGHEIENARRQSPALCSSNQQGILQLNYNLDKLDVNFIAGDCCQVRRND